MTRRMSTKHWHNGKALQRGSPYAENWSPWFKVLGCFVTLPEIPSKILETKLAANTFPNDTLLTSHTMPKWRCDIPACEAPALRFHGSCELCNRHLCAMHLEHSSVHSCPSLQV